MLKSLFSFAATAALLIVASTRAQADTLISVYVNTSSLSGEKGGIYFQFDPGLNADPASVSIADFGVAAPGALAPASPLNFSDGGASGSLDSNNLIILNKFALNDYGEALTFGADITFVVDLKIPAKLIGDSGSEFAMQITGPDLLTPLLTADPSGTLVTMSYNTTGALSVLSTNPDVARVSATVPEPGGFGLLDSALVLLLLFGRKRIPACGPGKSKCVFGDLGSVVATKPPHDSSSSASHRARSWRRIVPGV
jgi:hypothetical protein